MAIVNTQGSFNTGRDCTIVLIGPGGQQVQLDNVTGFEAQQITAKVNVDRLDGIQLNADLPKGWHGTLNTDRGSPSLDIMMATIEANWLNGGSYQVATMYQYIAEADGSTTTFAYDNVALTLENAGNWKSDGAVAQRLSFRANRRVAV